MGPAMPRFVFTFLLSLLPITATAQYVITTTGGTGAQGFSGNGGPALSAKFRGIFGVVVDNEGNVFVADTENQRVRRIDTLGTVITIAGKGTRGFCGDGGPARKACLNGPSGLALDAHGALLIADAQNHRVRKVDASGIITTVAGNGIGPYCGDTGPATSLCLNRLSGLAVDGDGNLYLTDNTRIRKVDSDGMMTTIAGGPEHGFCGDDGPAIDACLSTPEGIAVDGAGSIYFADYNNWRVRKIGIDGIVTTVAGKGVPGFCGDGGTALLACLAPFGVTVDSAGSVLIADSWNNRVRKVDASGMISTIAGSSPMSAACKLTGNDGPATKACVLTPSAVAVAADGALFVAEAAGARIRRLDVGAALTLGKRSVTGGCEQLLVKISLAAPAPPAGVMFMLTASSDRLILPPGVLQVPAGQVVFSLNVGTRVADAPEAVTLSASFIEALPWIADGLTRSSQLSVGAIIPLAVTLGPKSVFGGEPSAGIVQIACVAAQPVVVTLKSAKPASLMASTVTAAAGHQYARFEILTSPVTVQKSATITAIASGRTRSAKLVVYPPMAPTDDPWAKTIAGGGPLVTSPPPDYLIGDGAPATTAVLNPGGIALDPDGNLFVADPLNYRVRKVGLDGVMTTVAGNGMHQYCGDGGPAAAACLFNPLDVAVDAAGNLYIADGDRIRQVDTAGTISTLATTAPIFTTLTSIAVDAFGHVFVAASSVNRIMRYSPGGGITTFAGTGERNFCGDGGQAIDACLAFPRGVTVDAAGNVFIADLVNWRVRKVDAGGVITTVAGSGGSSFCSSLGDDGPATSACVAYPASVAVDAAGRLFVDSSYGGASGNLLRMVDEGGTISTISIAPGNCGPGGAVGAACFDKIADLVVEGLGNLVVADAVRVRRVLNVLP
jgi:sugar lactone lactonase YvrE